MTVLIRTIALAAGAALALGAQAFAGGDDYDASNDTEGAGPAYFGFVRDHRGAPVSDAQVMLHPKIGEPVAIKTNVLGLYRSHVNKDVTPDDVTVSCEKNGYRQVSITRRKQAADAPSVETSCTLERL